MTEMAMQASLLLDSKSNLVRLRKELWLSEAEIAIVDRVLMELPGNDRKQAAESRRKIRTSLDTSEAFFAHQQARTQRAKEFRTQLSKRKVYE
jgi:hypothetical protein